MMTSYQAAELLRAILRQFGMDETWIVAGGVDIQYRRRQRTALESVLFAMKNELCGVQVNLKLIERHKQNKIMFLDRKTMKIRHRKKECSK